MHGLLVMTIELPSPSKPSRNRSRERSLKAAHELLVWFFQQAEASCGIRSSFEAQRLQLAAGCSQSPTTNQYDVSHYREDVLLAVAQEREVSAVFASLPGDDQLVLSAHYQERAVSPVVRALLGEDAGLLRFVASDDYLLALIARKDREGVSELKACVRTMHRESLEVFARLWASR